MVDRICTKVSYDYFEANYLKLNKPCIFESWVTSDWNIFNDLLGLSKYSCLDYLVSKFNQATTVPVEEKFPDDVKCFSMLLFDFILYLKSPSAISSRQLYLKDWHAFTEQSTINFYRTPEFFKSDWMNMYWPIKHNDDFRFLYLGPKGTSTRLHVDVYHSYSWSANIFGKKKWILLPPGKEKNLSMQSGVLNESALKNHRDTIEVTQNEGEIIFIPSGWFHEVHNLEMTLSINHNWCNMHNIKYIWQYISDTLLKVEDEIQDVRDMENWHDQCQLILKADIGIDYKILIEMLLFIYESNEYGTDPDSCSEIIQIFTDMVPKLETSQHELLTVVKSLIDAQNLK